MPINSIEIKGLIGNGLGYSWDSIEESKSIVLGLANRVEYCGHAVSFQISDGWVGGLVWKSVSGYAFEEKSMLQ